MKKLMLLSLAIVLLMSLMALAQDTMKQDDSMKHDTMKSEKMSKKAVSISGKVADDGQTVVADKDGKTWKVSNPEALKGHEGHHVKVKAHVDADKDEIHVASVTMLKTKMKHNDKMK